MTNDKTCQVLHVLDKFYPPDPRVDGEAHALSKAGYNINLLVITKDKTKDYYHKAPFSIVKITHISNLTYRFSALAYTIPVYHIITFFKILSATRQYKPQILHVHDMVVARSCFWVSKLLGIKVILDLHENRPIIMNEYKLMEKPLSKLLICLKWWARAEKKMIQRSNKTIVVTQEAKDWYLEHYGISKSKITVVSNTISDQFKSQKINCLTPPATTSLIYIGDTGYRRGLSETIKALEITKGRGLEVELIIVGSSSYDTVLHDYVRENSLENMVHFVGWVPEIDLHKWLAKSQIGISPLHRNVHHDTTMANKISQYTLYSLPIIVSDCSAQAKLIQTYECGCVHEAANPRSIADCIQNVIELLQSSEKMKRRSEALFHEQFNPTYVYKNLLCLYFEEICQ